MQFLRIKPKNKRLKSGKQYAQAIVVEKDRKYGDIIKEQYISCKKSILIIGAASSGKSYWINRLYADYKRIWTAKSEIEPLYLSASYPIVSWTDGKHLELWWAMRDNPDEERHWSKLKAYERQDYLAYYLEETGALLFIDDAHTLNTRKLKIAQSCIRSANISIVTAIDEGRISASLRADIINDNLQIFRLSSDTPYDATAILMWIAMLVCASFGAYEVAIVLGGLKMLSGGRGAAKQN